MTQSADAARHVRPDEDAVLASLLGRRFSCRAFTSEPVPRATIDRILELAQRTASWCNSQPWQVVVTGGSATEEFRSALYVHASATHAQGDPDFPFPREYHDIYLARRRESGFQLYDALGVGRGDRDAYLRQVLENFRFFGAPHVAIVTSDEALGVYGAVDCGAYVANFLLAAEANGIAAIPQAALASYPELIRSHFGLGPDRRVVCGISFGRADASHPANSYRTSRAALADVVRMEGTEWT
ncbi:MAG TPA: nitroreductase [Rhodoblastus sp.]|nr:nitroreductase [Rhodoblastus sp.]